GGAGLVPHCLRVWSATGRAGDGLDDARAELGGADDGVDGADLDGALDAVHAVELRGHLAELLRADRRAELVELRGQRGAFGAGGGRVAGPHGPHARVRGGRRVSVAA